MIPTETEIIHFLEVYTTRHFTRSAIKLGIAQPSLSQSILRLEEKLKAKLFHRTKQGCLPTRAADVFHDKAVQLQENWENLSVGLTELNESLSGLFRLGCHPSVGAYTLPGFFKKLNRSAPKIQIRLHHDRSRSITEKIVNYELDLGFVVNPSPHPDLVLFKIGTDQVGFWQAKGIQVPPFLFADIQLIQTQSLMSQLKHSPLKNWQVVESSSLELIRTLVVNGAGVGIIPERIAKAENAKLELVDSKLPRFSDEIFLAYRVDTLRSAAGKAVIASAKN